MPSSSAAASTSGRCGSTSGGRARRPSKATGVGLRGGLTVRVDAPADRDGWRPVALDGHDAPLFVRDLRTPDAGVFGAIAIEGQPGVVQVVTTAVDERWA